MCVGGGIPSIPWAFSEQYAGEVADPGHRLLIGAVAVTAITVDQVARNYGRGMG